MSGPTDTEVLDKATADALRFLEDEKYANPTDREGLHQDADGVLLGLVRSLGFTKTADAYARISGGFWYS